MAGCARPVRIAANSSRVCSTAFSILVSASRRVWSITMLSPFRRVWWSLLGGVDQCSDLLTAEHAGDVALALHAEHDHGQFVLHAQGERGGVDDLEPEAERLVEGDLVEL